MRLTFTLATTSDAPDVAFLRNTVSADLLAHFGPGPWKSGCTERGVLSDLRQSSVIIARQAGTLVATFRLATKKPWAIDRAYFTPVPRPLYLTTLAVSPALQRQGLGRQCLAHAHVVARAWPAQSLCLDAHDAVAGAGDFYRQCGFREVGRATYRGVPLIYFESLL